MRRARMFWLVACGLSVGLAGVASAADFSPGASFDLSDTKVGANTELAIHVEQDLGEEELAHVTLTVPKGFALPKDKAIPNGEQLGAADITIDAGPRCAAAGPISAPAAFTGSSIFEQDRSDEQKDRGVKAVWVVDLRPVTTIPLEITGSKKKGYKLDGDIPANAFTCPPFTFDATIFDKTASGASIVKNPKSPGDKVFKAKFITQESANQIVIKQTITITP